jgi:hypothetical protein
LPAVVGGDVVTCRICQSISSDEVNRTYGLPAGLCLACGAGYLDGFTAGADAAELEAMRQEVAYGLRPMRAEACRRQRRAAKLAAEARALLEDVRENPSLASNHDILAYTPWLQVGAAAEAAVARVLVDRIVQTERWLLDTA